MISTRLTEMFGLRHPIVDQIRRIERAATLVRRIAADTEKLLLCAGAKVDRPRHARERAAIPRHPMPQQEST